MRSVICTMFVIYYYRDNLAGRACRLLAEVIHANHFDSVVAAGRCLCYLLLHASPFPMIEMTEQVHIIGMTFGFVKF